jgi:hypothetical protein
MKLLFTSLLSLCFVNIFAQTDQIFVVKTPDEFVDAIGSNRTIQLQGSIFYLSNISSTRKSSFFSIQGESENEHELTIQGVSNLKIVGAGDKPVEICIKPEEGDVLSFVNCNGITIENIDAGHGPTKGGCDGGVFNFINCKNVNIINSIMYGSGTYGIKADKVSNLLVNNSIIRGCSRMILYLENSQNVEFKNCLFTENETEYGNLITISNCITVKFENTKITRNILKSESDEYFSYFLFEVSKSMGVSLSNCEIRNNYADYMANKPNVFDLKNVNLENNTFRLGNFKD